MRLPGIGWWMPVVAFGPMPVTAQAAGEPLLLTPSSDWIVDYAEDSCALRRTFAGGSDTAILELRQTEPADGYEITLVSDTVPRTTQAPRVRYSADEEWAQPVAMFFVDGGDQHGVRFTDSLRPASLKPEGQAWAPWSAEARDARETAVTQVTVADSFERELTLRTGKMHQPMDAMRACMRELVSHWGIDGAVQETLSRRVVPIDQMNWVRQTIRDYPVSMRNKGKGAEVPIRVIVGADGKPTACAATIPLDEPAFEQAACKAAIRYARFEPALDAAGKPTSSYYRTRIVYQP